MVLRCQLICMTRKCAARHQTMSAAEGSLAAALHPTPSDGTRRSSCQLL
jgi:hypothetical protein